MTDDRLVAIDGPTTEGRAEEPADQLDTCRVYWGAAGCDLPRGHDDTQAVRQHRRERTDETVTVYTAFLFGEDLTTEELRLRIERYGE